MYDRDSSLIVVANNLASLLSTYKDDTVSLEKAWAIARRLRKSEVPAFQDTYGWIAHLRGDSEEALPYLESAVQSLPDDPLVHFHLAEIYTALGRSNEALSAYNMAVQVAAPTDSRAQIAKARAQIRALQSNKDAVSD